MKRKYIVLFLCVLLAASLSGGLMGVASADAPPTTQTSVTGITSVTYRAAGNTSYFWIVFSPDIRTPGTTEPAIPIHDVETVGEKIKINGESVHDFNTRVSAVQNPPLGAASPTVIQERKSDDPGRIVVYLNNNTTNKSYFFNPSNPVTEIEILEGFSYNGYTVTETQTFKVMPDGSFVDASGG
ncbi:MAG: hypothetical protein LBH24_05230, partial [Clostridiales bacterium]|nr:hypothetical protein [Clostridiales bacterium]